MTAARIGNCRILEEIGSGGMAVIYKAEQESLGRTVALKTLKPAVALNAQVAERFEREARSLGGLQHENIIQIFDFHREGGNCYIVMEYVEGIDLYDLLERCRRVPPDIAAIVGLQVSRALDYAHYREIIHRDIKPANIMLSKQGGVKLMDFGIARDLSLRDMTETGTGLGTPSYMSPEQILGDKLDFRSDIFSLGIVLYQMATGHKPFIEDDKKSVMHKIRLDRYPSPRRLNKEIPRGLERIIARCLQKHPSDRYRSTQDLVFALERFVARRVSVNYRARLVVYLSSQGIISDAEATGYLHPALVGPAQSAPTGPVPRFPWTRGNLVVIGVAALAVLLVRFPGASKVTAPPPPPPNGYLRIVANPWAEIWVDGRRIETTPVARQLAVPEGKHKLELRNPYFHTEKRDIEIPRDRVVSLRVDLARRSDEP